MNPVAIMDIETDGLGGPFVLGAIYYPQKGKTEVYRWQREREMVDTLLAIDGEIYAHNGGRYDYLWLLDQIGSHGGTPVDIATNGQGIIRMRIGRAVFLDSLRIFPMSLAKLTGGAKKSLGALCDCGKECGGYCAIRRDQTEAKLKVIEEYCVADVVELGNALDYFSARAADWGLSIGITLGSTSWKSAARELSLPKASLSLNAWQLARAGYHGGRSEVFRIRSESGYACDVNSMYPFSLSATPLPVGFERLRHGTDALSAWHSGKAGIYSATVWMPESFIPCLPVGFKTGMAFPWGRLTGTWPRPELEYALETGARLENVHSAVTFSHTELIFGSWVERLFALRMRYGKQTREGAWLKWICNSLTGKLGSKNERHSVKLWPEPSELKPCRCRPAWDCHCGAFRPMDLNCRTWVSTVKMAKLEPCAHAEWAAYLTGVARVKLHRQLVAGDGDAVYCDTDSVWSESERTVDIGSELGQWEPKGRYENFEALGPKTYHAILDGKEETAAKGIPNPEWLHLRSGAANSFASVRGIKRAKKGEPFFAFVPQSRRVTPNTGRRILDSGGILTRAIELT